MRKSPTLDTPDLDPEERWSEPYPYYCNKPILSWNDDSLNAMFILNFCGTGKDGASDLRSTRIESSETYQFDDNDFFEAPPYCALGICGQIPLQSPSFKAIS